MRRAHIVHDGRPVWASVSDDGNSLTLPNSKSIFSEDAVFLPPVSAGATVFALGLNYADHRKELGFAAKEPPLIFLKGANTFTGHKGRTHRPSDASQMHPECELVAIIGRPTKGVSASSALDHISGYTIANDYAIREYLENYHRPNLRVKNRDGATPIGPWIIDASTIPDPQSLKLKTTVNGVVVQEGSTADMVMSVAELIAYISETMTLLPGDMILTGTPSGIHFVNPGDVVVCEIERIGALANTLEAV